MVVIQETYVLGIPTALLNLAPVGILLKVWEMGEEEGRAIGEAIGEASGRAIGEANGIAIGEARGQHEKATMIAIKLKNKGASIEEIQELTELNIEEIEAL